MNGFAAGILGAATGLMFVPGATNRCFNTIQSSLFSWDNFGMTFTRIYMPWYWADLQIVMQDSITLGTDFWTQCDIDKMFVTCTKLITVEGLSELGSRAVGAIFFEYSDLISGFGKDEDDNPLNSAYEIGILFGRAISVTLA